MKQNVTIDRLRGCSVLVVILLHYGIFYPKTFAFLGFAVSNGYYGVTAFFCTSGFLITSNLLNRYGQVGSADLYAFYVRRFGRIFPPLALLLVALSLLSMTAIKAFNFPPPFSLKDSLLYVLTLRYNVYLKFCGGTMPMWGVLWSLSIEEVFYLVYPLLAKIVWKSFWLMIVLAEIAICAPLYRLRDLGTIYEYFGCFDAIAIGALSAFAAQRFSGKVYRLASWVLMIAGISVLLYVYLITDLLVQYPVTLTLVALGAALVLFASQCIPFSNVRALAFDPLVYLGRVSYEVYLFHVMIFVLLKTITDSHPAAPGILVFVAAFLCVAVTSEATRRFYAEPINQWLRNKLLPLRKSPMSEIPSRGQVDLRAGFPVMKFVRLTCVALLCAQSVYAFRKVLPLFQTPETVVDIPQHLEFHSEIRDLIVHNPQGVDGAGDAVFFWIGPDITIELIDRSPLGSVERRFSLVFNVEAGPSNSARARRIVLCDAEGNEQPFDFKNTAVAHFDVTPHAGRNVYTLKVAYPTEMNVDIPADPRLFLVRADHFTLAELPMNEPKATRQKPIKSLS